MNKSLNRYPILRSRYINKVNMVFKYTMQTAYKIIENKELYYKCIDLLNSGEFYNKINGKTILIFDNEGDTIKLKYENDEVYISMFSQYSEFLTRNLYRGIKNDSNLGKKLKVEEETYLKNRKKIMNKVISFGSKKMSTYETTEKIKTIFFTNDPAVRSFGRHILMLAYYMINPYIIENVEDETVPPKSKNGSSNSNSKPKQFHIITIYPNNHIIKYNNGITLIDIRNSRTYKSIWYYCVVTKNEHKYSTIARQTRENTHQFLKRVNIISM